MHPPKQGYRNIKQMVKNHNTKRYDLVTNSDSSCLVLFLKRKLYVHPTITLIKTLLY